MTRLSICIPTYNRLYLFRNLLKKLDKISYGSCEIIVSDDSTNNEVENYFKRYPNPRIRYFKNSHNLGTYGNCNACIARATGEWIQILHDDDDINPDYLNSIEHLLEDSSTVMITGRVNIIGENATLIGEKHTAKLKKIGLSSPGRKAGPALIPLLIAHGNPFVFSHVIFRRDRAISIGGFDSRLKYKGDIDMWLRLLTMGDVVTADVHFGDYYLHGNSYTESVCGKWEWMVESVLQRIRHMNVMAASLSEREYLQYIRKIRQDIVQARFYARHCLHDSSVAGRLEESLKHQNIGRCRIFHKYLPYLFLGMLPYPISFNAYNSLLKLRKE